jgi:tol-pal system protein YbgF
MADSPMHENRIRLAKLTAMILLSFGVSSAAIAQSRLSLAERVARLEAQSQGSGQAQNQIELLNRVEQLQAEVQDLRNVIEQQQFEIENLKRSPPSRPGVDMGAASAFGGTAAPTPTPVPGPGGLMAEPIENLTAPVDPAAAENLAQSAPGIAEVPAENAPAAAAGDERAMYDQAFSALRDGRYAESARLFRDFLDVHPDGELAPNALYWLGESYYVTQNFQIALDTFNELLTRFPESPKAQDALLKVGYCHYELKQWPEAERALNEVVQRYPDTTLARLAQGRLRALRLDAQRR